MSLDTRIDSFVGTEPDPLDTLTEAPEFEPTQVAGLGSALTGIVKKLTGKGAAAAPTAAAPSPAAVVPPAAAPAPPTPTQFTPPVRPNPNKVLTQPEQVGKLITPEVAQDVAVQAEVRAVIEPELMGKPPDELFNYMRTGLPDDINKFIDETAKAAGVVKPTRVTHKEVTEDLIASGYKPKDLDWIVNYADNTEQMHKVALSRELLVSLAKSTQDLAKELVTSPTPDLALKYHQSTVLLGQVSRGVKNIGTDYARALGVMRATPTGDLGALDEVINGLGGLENVVAHAGKLARLDLDNVANVRKFADLSEKSMWSKVKDVWVTTWINGLLSSPITHAKNILGNELFTAIQAPERFAGAAIGRLRGAEVGDRVEMGEATAMLRGIVAGQMKGLEAFGQAWMKNAPVTTAESKLSEAGATLQNFGQHLGLGGMLGRAADAYGTVVTLPGRTLMAEDEYFKVQGYYMELYAQATRHGAAAREEAIAAGATLADAKKIEANAARGIIDSPPEDINAAAWDTAKYVTFTEPLERGTVGRAFQDLAATNLVARMHLPFVRTPVNLWDATLERTPFAIFTKSFHEARAAGGVERDMALARLAVGSSILTSAGYLASTGRIMGAGPGDKGQKEAQERSGVLPYSIVFYEGETDAETRQLLGERGRITETEGKVFWSFQGLEPLGGILSVGANYADYAKYEDDVGLVEQVALGSAYGLANYTMELPYLQGMSEFVRALTGYGAGEIKPNVVRRLVDSLSKTATSFVIGGSPAGAYSSLQATAERFVEPEASETFVPTSVEPGLRGVMQAFEKYRSRTPGLSSFLPPKTNRWGEPIMHGEGELHETVSPLRVKEGKQMPVDRLWLEYQLPRGQPDKRISWPQRSDMSGITVEMPVEAHNEMKRLYAWEVRDGDGRNVQDALVALTKDRAWDRLSFGDQQRMLLKVDSVFMNAARSMIVNESRFAPALQAKLEEQKRAADTYGRFSDELRD